jgi:hypothetical protein
VFETFEELEPGDIVLPEWNPTPAELAAFRKRDKELAEGNVRMLFERYGWAKPSDTFHTLDGFCHGFQTAMTERSR